MQVMLTEGQVMQLCMRYFFPLLVTAFWLSTAGHNIYKAYLVVLGMGQKVGSPGRAGLGPRARPARFAGQICQIRVHNKGKFGFLKYAAYKRSKILSNCVIIMQYG